MGNPFEEEFRGIAKEYYPGSSRTREVGGVKRPSSKPDDADWDRHPKRFKIAGVEQEFFGIGALAEALEREPVTIRKWERDGVIPRATFRLPSADPRGARRLYSRAQVEGIVALAGEEGLMNPAKRPALAKTQFPTKVKTLFEELRNGDR